MSGAGARSYGLLVTGRVIFGFGGESLKLCNSAIEALWFNVKEIAFVMSIDYCLANMGTFLNDTLAPTIYSRSGSLQFVFLVGLTICVFSWFASTFVFCLDQAREQDEAQRSQLRVDSGSPVARAPPVSQLKAIREFPFNYWMIMVAYVCSPIQYFNNISSEFFQNKFNFSLQNAGFLIGLEGLVSGLVAPWLGRILDRAEHKLRFGTVSFYTMS